jgi:hypothetical protein
MKFTIPLQVFEKRSTLTPSAVSYLTRYSKAVRISKGNPAILERIGTILRKPHIPDPIYESKTYLRDASPLTVEKIMRPEGFLTKLFKRFNKKTAKLQ